jgi:hypothetical protein
MTNQADRPVRFQLWYRLGSFATFLFLMTMFAVQVIWHWRPTGTLSSVGLLVLLLLNAPTVWYRRELYAAFRGDEGAIDLLVGRRILERTRSAKTPQPPAIG